MPRTSDQIALNDWYVVAALSNLVDHQTRRTRLLGQDILVGTDAAGQPTCREITDGQPDRIVQHIATRYDFVWICLGEPSRGIVEIEEMTDPERRFLQRGRIGVATSGQRVIENFFDLSHFSFVHTGTLGGYDNTEVSPYAVNFREESAELWATECRFFQPMASAASGGGVETHYNYRIPSPFISIIYKGSPSKPGHNDIVGLFVQPRDETDCVVHSFGLVYNYVSDDTALLHFFHEVFAQDRSVMIHQQPKKLPLMPRREIPTQSDALSIAYRRWLDRSGLQFGVDRELDEAA